MSSARHVEPEHPLKGRMAYLPALLTPSDHSQDQTAETRVDRSDAPRSMSPPAAAGQKRKRPRAARACEFCREKKYRCDELDPCSRCRKRKSPCVYKNADLARERLSAAQARDLDDAFLTTLERHNPDLGSHIDANNEVSEVNPHTLNTEFHGRTSSLAFLAAVQQHAHKDTTVHSGQPQSVVSAFHNESFSPQTARPRTAGEQSPSSTRYHFRQSRFFLEGYFQNLHFIHPIIERADFYSKCEDLWFGRPDRQPPSFVSLYYAVMSLGCLIQEWDEEAIDGLDRFEWARKMFSLASEALELTMGHSDLEIVQACIIMAKVCQNELNPHLAYLYLGRAVRTALSAGFNRRPRSTAPVGRSDISKTWWGLYSLEIEMSFALGRPDSLGMDIYHNQTMPPVDDTEHAILAVMVDLGRIFRQVSVSTYAPARSISERIETASSIEGKIDAWVESLPITIRPTFHDEQMPIMAKEPKWAKKQKHTLKFRYFNVKMVLYRPFLLHAASLEDSVDPDLHAAVTKCVSAARATIQLMHQMYCELPYFRTWFYNITYTLYAASILLCYLSRLAQDEDKHELQQHIQMSIDVFAAMDEHVVARKAGVILQQAAQQVETKGRQPAETPLMQLANVSAGIGTRNSANESLLDPFQDINLDFLGQRFPFDDNYMSPWLA